MINRLFNGITNAEFGEQMRIMTLFVLFLIMGTAMMNVRGGESQQSRTRITGAVVDQTGELPVNQQYDVY
jgi:hypothetical protein